MCQTVAQNTPGCLSSGSKLERPILWTDGHPKETAAVIVVPDFLVLKQQTYGDILLSKSLRPYRGVLPGWASHGHKDDAKWWSFAGPAPNSYLAPSHTKLVQDALLHRRYAFR